MQSRVKGLEGDLMNPHFSVPEHDCSRVDSGDMMAL